MVMTKEEVTQYLADTKLNDLLQTALNSAISATPGQAEVAAFLAKHFDEQAVLKDHRGMQALSQDAKCMLDHSRKLDIYSDPAAARSTGIICTIGPKTKSPEMITNLRKCGLNIVRMNFSHGSYEYHGEVIASTRKSCEAEAIDGGRLVAIALDTKGPEIRSGDLKEGLGSTVMLEKGTKILVTTDPAEKPNCSAEQIYMDYVNLPKVMAVGQSIMVDDGLIELKVESKDEAAGTMMVEVVNSGDLGS